MKPALDKLQLFPNQRIDGDPFECCGITIADILGNALGFPCDPDYPYSLGFYINDAIPADTGIQPRAAMDATVTYGILPSSLDTTSAASMGELYVANFNNYTPQQKQAALQYAQNGVKTLRTITDYQNYLQTYKQGALLAMRWYQVFNSPYSDGTLPIPNYSFPYSYHAVAVYGSTPQGLVIKPLLGKEYGLGGYAILPETVFNMTFEEGYGFQNDAWRWLSLAYIGLRYPRRLNDILPQLATIK